MVGPIEDHAPGGKLVEDRRLERRGRIVGLEIKGRLVVGDDEENVGALVGGPDGLDCGKQQHQQGRRYFHGTDHRFLPGWVSPVYGFFFGFLGFFAFFLSGFTLITGSTSPSSGWFQRR